MKYESLYEQYILIVPGESTSALLRLTHVLTTHWVGLTASADRATALTSHDYRGNPQAGAGCSTSGALCIPLDVRVTRRAVRRFFPPESGQDLHAALLAD